MRFGVKDGNVVAELTRRDSKDVNAGASPAYMVSDSAVELAARARRNASRHGITMDEAFTHHIIWSVKLPAGDLSYGLRNALSDVIGSIRMDTAWDAELGDEEAEGILNEMKGEE